MGYGPIGGGPSRGIGRRCGKYFQKEADLNRTLRPPAEGFIVRLKRTMRMAVTPVRPARRDGAAGAGEVGADGSADAGEDSGQQFEDFDKELRDTVDNALNVSSWTA